MGEPRTVEVRDMSGGVNFAKPAIRLKPNETDIQLNGWVRDEAYCKRPGLTKDTVNPLPDPIIDLVAYGWDIATNIFAGIFATTFGRGLGGGSQTTGLYYKNSTARADFTIIPDVGSGFVTNDIYMIGKAIPVGANPGYAGANGALMFYISGAYAAAIVPNRSRYILQSSTYLRIADVPAATTQIYATSGAWHRGHLFTGYSQHGTYSRHSIWRSEYGKPESFLATGTGAAEVPINPTGATGLVLGIKSAGDTAYVMKADGIHWITGYDLTTFRYDRLPTEHGGCFSRAFAQIGAGLIGFSVTENGPDQNQRNNLTLKTIISISGQSVVDIGGRVRSLLGMTVADEGCRVEYWSMKGLVLLIPTIGKTASDTQVLTAAATDIIVYDPTASAFWVWKVDKSCMAGAMTPHRNTIFLGCMDGHVRYFDETAATDDGAAFDSYYAHSEISIVDKTIVADAITIYGTQTSGGMTSVSVSINGEAFREAGRVNLCDPKAPYGIKISSIGLVDSAKRMRVKVTFPPDGVGCKYYGYDPAIKEQGRV